MSSVTPDLSALLNASTIEDHEAVIKASNAKLRHSVGHLETQHVKIVALSRLERYEDVLRTLAAGGERLKQVAQFEQAYALYKTGAFEEASNLAKSIRGDRGARHLEAQAVRYTTPAMLIN